MNLNRLDRLNEGDIFHYVDKNDTKGFYMKAFVPGIQPDENECFVADLQFGDIFTEKEDTLVKLVNRENLFKE